MEIIGHQQILDFFDKVIKNNNLSHAYCFVGPESAGKRTVAEYLAAKLMGIESDKLNTCPDFTAVEQSIDEKTGKSKKDISVAQIRDLRQALSRRSALGGYKAAVIDKAEKMSMEAANALLKTLEEPTEKTVLFLLTRDETQLPETIRSRCQMIYFHTAPKELLQKKLIKEGLSEREAEEMSRLACGLPGRALKWLQNPEDYELYKKEINRFLSLMGEPFYEKLKKIEDLFGDKADHIATRGNLQSILSIWLLLIRDAFYKKIKLENYQIHSFEAGNLSRNLLIEIEKSIKRAKLMLDKNIHPRLLIENILLKMP